MYLVNKCANDSLQSVGNKFSNDLVNATDEADRYIISQGCRVFDFQNKCDKGRITPMRDLSYDLDMFDITKYIILHDAPFFFLIRLNMYPSGLRAFSKPHPQTAGFISSNEKGIS